MKHTYAASLAVAAVLSFASRLEAVPITITWQGEWKFYNGDHLVLCEQGSMTTFCDFYPDLASLGIRPLPNSNVSDALVTLALTLEGSQLLEEVFVTPSAVRFSAGALSFSSDPVLLTVGVSVDTVTAYGAAGPLPTPILGKYQPGGLMLWFEQLQRPPHGTAEAMFTSFLLAPPRTSYCLAFISGDCDAYGNLTMVSITRNPRQVPEPSVMALLLPAVGIAVWKSRKRHSSIRRHHL